MPARSNQFQRVVNYIAEKLAPLGATVRESVMLPERGLEGVVREVDTLIEVSAGITLVRVAVESRDRKRTDVVVWIDELIGKYKHLSVDRIIAVSSSGFSASAKAKAALNGIELLTPKEIEGADWPAEFRKLGAGIVDGRVHIESVQFTTTPPLPGTMDVERDTLVQDHGAGQFEEATVRQFLDAIGPKLIERVQRHHKENFLSIYKTRADLQKIAVVEVPIPLPANLSLVSNGTSHRVESITARVLITMKETVMPVSHKQLGTKGLITSVKLDDISMTIAQVANAGEGKVFVERAPKRRKKKTTAKKK